MIPRKAWKWILLSSLVIIVLLIVPSLVSLDIINIVHTGNETVHTDNVVVLPPDFVGPPATYAGWKHIQTFNMPSGKNRLAGIRFWVTSFSGNAALRVGVASSLTWDESQWLLSETTTITTTNNFQQVLGSSDSVVFISGQRYWILFYEVNNGASVTLSKSNYNSWAGGYYGHDNYNPSYSDEGTDLCFILYAGEYYQPPPDNHDPVCSQVSGPTNGFINQPYTFTATASDEDGDSLTYFFDWDDGTGIHSSGTSSSMSHSWSISGVYHIYAMVQDEHQAWSDVSPELVVTITNQQSNDPPICDSIVGPSRGKPGTTYNFSVNAYDPDSNDITYFVDWGDNSNTGWVSIPSCSHAWSNEGNYSIKAKVKDSLGSESGWCSPLSITISTGPIPTTYTVIFKVLSKTTNQPIPSATVSFNSQTKISDSSGLASFIVPQGSYLASVTISGYKSLAGTLTITDSVTIKALMASEGSSDISSFVIGSPSPVPWESWALFIGAIITGIILTILFIVFLPGISIKIGLSFILWIIIIILILLGLIPIPFSL